MNTQIIAAANQKSGDDLMPVDKMVRLLEVKAATAREDISGVSRGMEKRTRQKHDG